MNLYTHMYIHIDIFINIYIYIHTHSHKYRGRPGQCRPCPDVHTVHVYIAQQRSTLPRSTSIGVHTVYKYRGRPGQCRRAHRALSARPQSARSHTERQTLAPTPLRFWLPWPTPGVPHVYMCICMYTRRCVYTYIHIYVYLYV